MHRDNLPARGHCVMLSLVMGVSICQTAKLQTAKPGKLYANADDGGSHHSQSEETQVWKPQFLILGLSFVSCSEGI